MTPNKKWLLFNMAFTRGEFINMIGSGYYFCLAGPQKIHGIRRFKGIEWRRMIKPTETITIGNPNKVKLKEQ